jgi:SAM-dependent methyltransferase
MTVTGYDINPKVVARLNGLVEAYPFLPIEVKQEDIVSADLGHEKYDTVLLGQTFIHFPSKDLAYAVLDKAIDSLKPGGHLWIRAAGKEASSYEEMQEASEYGFLELRK